MPWVFVYGTLKRGQSNVHVMAGARFAAPALSVQRWKLVGLRHYPAMVREDGPARIAGELWEVPEEMMEMLDRFEEVPDLYIRHEIEVECLAADAAGARLLAHAYFMPAVLAAAGREILCGSWPE